MRSRTLSGFAAAALASLLFGGCGGDDVPVNVRGGLIRAAIVIPTSGTTSHSFRLPGCSGVRARVYVEPHQPNARFARRLVKLNDSHDALVALGHTIAEPRRLTADGMTSDMSEQLGRVCDLTRATSLLGQGGSAVDEARDTVSDLLPG